MALLYMDGFDAGDYALRWAFLAGTPTGLTTGRFGTGNALNIGKDSSVTAHSFPASSKTVVGMAAYHTFIGSGTGNNEFIGLYGDNSATQHINVRVMQDGALGLYRGTTQLAVTTGGLVSINWWHYIELSATIADSGGIAKVRLNGVEVLSFTGDTKNGGTNTSVDQVRLRGLWSANSGSYIDDLYIADGTGAANNDFLGDVRVQTLSPAGAGSSTQLTPSTGANWSCVDELPSSATDYVSSSTAGARDTYATSDLLVGTSSVKAVQLAAVAKKTDAGSRSLKTALRTGGTNYSGTAMPLTVTDNAILSLRETNPATSAAWTVADVNAMEIGVEVA